MANRTTALLSKLFKFALDDELIEASPAVRISRPGAEQKRDRVLSDDELRTLWVVWDGLSSEMAAHFKLRLITAQPGGEVAAMRWKDVDLKAGWWTVPAGVAKNKLAHRVPLSASALTILKALRATAAKDAVYVLAGARGKRQQSEAAATFGVPDFRGHDLRRTAASLMAGGGISRLVIGKILNHVEKDITAVYDRHGDDAEKQAALTWWDTKLAAILANKTATVLPFQRGAQWRSGFWGVRAGWSQSTSAMGVTRAMTAFEGICAQCTSRAVVANGAGVGLCDVGGGLNAGADSSRDVRRADCSLERHLRGLWEHSEPHLVGELRQSGRSECRGKSHPRQLATQDGR